MTEATLYQLALLERHRYLDPDFTVDYAISPDGKLHLSPHKCWPRNPTLTAQDKYATVQQLLASGNHPACECGSWRPVHAWGHPADPVADRQMAWLTDVSGHGLYQPTTTYRAADITFITYRWMTRPAPGSNTSLNAEVADQVTTLKTARDRILTTSEYQEALSVLLLAGVRRAQQARGMRPVPGRETFADLAAVRFPPMPGWPLTAQETIDRYLHPAVWVLVDDFDASLGNVLMHCDPERDGYRVSINEALVKVPAAIAIEADLLEGAVVGVDAGYTAEEVGTAQDIIAGGGITLADAVAALRAARN